MLHINDDNNDELFRRAAEHYPVKTDSADWDLLRAKMDATPEEEDRPAIIPWWKRYRFLWLLLLLIPLGIAENKYKFIGRHFINEKENSATVTSQSTKANKDLDEGIKDIGKETTPVTQVAASTDQLNTKQTEHQVNRSGEQINSTADQQSNTITNQQNNTATEPEKTISRENNSTVAGRNIISSNQKSKMKVKNSLPDAGDEVDEVEKVNKVGAGKKNIVRSAKQKQKMKMQAAVASGEEVEEPKTVEKVAEPDTQNTLVAIEEEKKPEEKTAAKKDTITTKEPVKEIAKTDTKPDKKEKKKSTKHFYIGLIGGPDFSTIKLQSVKKTGLNFGFIAGYKINNHFSVETGILKDKKFYSSKGQYFSTKNIYLPPNATIEYVDGECNMIEWPVNVMYNFRQKARSGFFASAGVSSYFMKNESYVYDISRNGYRYPYSYDYKSKNTALFAVINISAGYTYKLGRIADLRIEPYVKLPVNKVGTGKLPIQSAGVMIGITKTIF